MQKGNFRDLLTATATMRVPFHDVDPANVVWHGRYFKYFEEARRTLFDDLQYSYHAMMESGYIWPVVDANIRYVRPLLLDQQFEVTATIVEWELRIVVNYRINDANGVLCTKGRTVQVPLDATTLELCIGTPAIWQQKIEQRLEKRRQ